MIRPRRRARMDLERRHRSVNEAEVGDLGHPAELFRRDLGDGGEDGLHRVVDPEVDGAEFLFEPRRGGEHLRRVGDVGRLARGVRAQGDEFAPDLLERLGVASDEADPVPCAGEASGDRAADAGGRSCDDDGAGRHALLGPRDGE